MLVNKGGNPVLKDAQVPVYWHKRVAARDALKYKCEVARVTIHKIDKS